MKTASRGHVVWLIGLYVVATVLYVVEVVMSSLSGISNNGIFQNSVGNISDYFYLEITPASWTFSIWGFIYTWQALWLVYAFTLICRRGESGYLYVNPMILPVGLLISFCFSSVVVTAWLFAWDRMVIAGAFATLLLTAISLHITLVFGHHQLNIVQSTLIAQGLRKDVWLVRILVLNGLAFYNTWVSIATCLNLAHLLTYGDHHTIPQETASTVALALLMAVIFTWFILKNFIFEKHLRFTLSPIIVLVVGLTGSLYKNWDRNKSNSVFTAMLLTVVGILSIITITHVIVRQRKDNCECKDIKIINESA